MCSLKTNGVVFIKGLSQVVGLIFVYMYSQLKPFMCTASAFYFLHHYISCALTTSYYRPALTGKTSDPSAVKMYNHKIYT